MKNKFSTKTEKTIAFAQLYNAERDLKREEEEIAFLMQTLEILQNRIEMKSDLISRLNKTIAELKEELK